VAQVDCVDYFVVRAGTVNPAVRWWLAAEVDWEGSKNENENVQVNVEEEAGEAAVPAR
jgi:hypothetical protein